MKTAADCFQPVRVTVFNRKALPPISTITSFQYGLLRLLLHTWNAKVHLLKHRTNETIRANSQTVMVDRVQPREVFSLYAANRHAFFH